MNGNGFGAVFAYESMLGGVGSGGSGLPFVVRDTKTPPNQTTVADGEVLTFTSADRNIDLRIDPLTKTVIVDFATLPIYNNDTAALAAGLVEGDMYRVSGDGEYGLTRVTVRQLEAVPN